ncbi:MAG: N-acetyltransferase family protein [Haloarculaceae archaeon]
MSRTYPDEPAGEFPPPPRTITDGEGRTVTIEVASEVDPEDLVEMYRAFDPADRAQGIPPIRETAIREWLETILEAECVNVVATHEGSAVGHATLVPDDEGEHELAIFVLSSYQGAGIGTELLRTLLGRGQELGIDRVWLTVERWNDPAIAVYEKAGFETCDSASFELEMAIRLG